MISISTLRRFAFSIAFFSLFLTSAASRAEDANAIVAKADAVRAPKGSYEFDATIASYSGESKKSENGYKVYVQDLDHSLVEFKSPASEKGKSLLMVEEDLWVYLPSVKKPVRIPLAQRLVGDVSNGDMARANLAQDYTATLAGEEKVDGQDAYVLDLVANSANKTYNKIKYWVAKQSYRPLKAEYFTVSGKSLKTCSFEDFRSEGGTVRPMRLVFQDALDSSKRSILQFQRIEKKSLDQAMFTKEYMKTLE